MSLRFAGSKTSSVIIKVIAFLIASMVFEYFLPADFLCIELSIEGFERYVNNEVLSLPQLFNLVWNNNIYVLSCFIFRVIILLLLGFRFKKAENLQLSRHTVIIVLSCVILSAIGYSYKLYYEFMQYGLRWQTSISDFFRYFITVGMVEEVIHRGFITNELFQLKQGRLITPVAIVISAVAFGFIHVDKGIINFFRYGFVPTINVLIERFVFPASCGVSLAVILYYKRDIATLICIHAVNNMLSDSYTYTGNTALGVLYVAFFIVFVVCYPVYLIIKARKEAKVLNSPHDSTLATQNADVF